MLILLVLVLLGVLWLLFLVHKRDILYPSVMVCIAYLISISFAIINWNEWDMSDYSVEAFTLTVLGIVVFAIVGIIVEKIIFAQRKCIVGRSRIPENSIKEITVTHFIIAFDFFICIVTLIWYFSEMRRIAGVASNWGTMLASFRIKTSYGILGAEERMPFVLSQMFKLVLAQGYFFAYVLVNNILARGFKRKDTWMIILVVMMIIQTILSAGRMELLKLSACIMCASYVLWHRKYGWNRNISNKFIGIGFISLCGLFIGFYLLKSVVGRINDYGLVYYISYYTGGPIKLFDLYLKNPPPHSGIWGEKTFFSLHQFFSRYLGIGESYVRNLEFRSYHGAHLGNVYTALRRYHDDFGVIGIIVLMAIFSLFIHYLYCKVKYSKIRHADYFSLLCCYLYFTIPILPIDDLFYTRVVSVTYLLNSILPIYVLYIIIIKKSIRVRLGRGLAIV